MKPVKWTLRVLVTLTCFALVGSASAQRLYDAKRDEQAQAALKIVADLQSGTLFDKQLKNLSLLAKRDMETTLLSSRSSMRTDINSFITWSDVNSHVSKVKTDIGLPNPMKPDEVLARLTELQPRIDAAATALDELEAEAECKKDPQKCPEQKPGALALFFDRAEELKDIQEAVTSFRISADNGNNDVSAAVEEVKAVLGVLESLYKKYTERMHQYNKLEGELLDLQIPLKKVALQALQVEAQHWKNILRIYAQRGVEEANIRRMITEYEKSNCRLGYGYTGTDPAKPCEGPLTSGSPPEDNIEMTLRSLLIVARRSEQRLVAAELSAIQPDLTPLKKRVLDTRSNLQDTMVLLHVATSLVARGRMPKELADLRLAQEEHAYSIRRSGVMARAYQLTVSTGVRRLALYHKGGLKPSAIARLIHTAATVAIPPVIAAN